MAILKVRIRDKKTKSGIKKECFVYFPKPFLEKLYKKGMAKYGQNISFLMYFDKDNHKLWRMKKTSIEDKDAYKLAFKSGLLSFTLGLEKQLVLTSENFMVKSIDDIKFIDADTIEFELIGLD